MQRGFTRTKDSALSLTPWLRAVLLAALLCLSLVVMATPAAYASTTQVSHPQTNTVPCWWPGWANLDIYYGNGAEICFAGSGYLGYTFTGAYEIDNLGGGNSWIKYYDVFGSANFFNIPAYTNGYITDGYITQICDQCPWHP